MGESDLTGFTNAALTINEATNYWTQQPPEPSKAATSSLEMIVVMNQAPSGGWDDWSGTWPSGNLPVWLADVRANLEAATRLPRGWDSYDARPTSAKSARDAFRGLVGWMNYVRSAPDVIPTPQGGVIYEWTSHDSVLDVIYEPRREPRVYFSNDASNEEFEDAVTNAVELGKWLWATSSRY